MTTDSSKQEPNPRPPRQSPWIAALWIAVIVQAALLVDAYLFYPVRNLPHVQARTVYDVNLGNTFSLLIDGERFPIGAKPGQQVSVEIHGVPRYQSSARPEDRTRVPFSTDEQSAATIHEPRFRFVYNEPAELNRLAQQEGLATLKGADDWQTIKNVLHWTRAQFDEGKPQTYPPQNAASLLKFMRDKKQQGLCSQYCYVAVQSLQALGYRARYVTIKGHEVLEVWSPQLNQWVCLDPANEAYFQSNDNKPLSALDIRRLGDMVNVVSPIYTGPKEKILGGYRMLSYWLKNDLFTNPINVYDVSKYTVRAVLNENDLADVPPGELFTIYPDELYLPPPPDAPPDAPSDAPSGAPR